MRITKTVMLHVCGCTLLAPWAGWAQTQTASVPELPPVLVEADLQTADYLPQSAVSVTGPLPLTLRENPQSVSVVTEKRMQDQNLTTTIDALKWVPGLTFGSQDETEGNTVWSRGYVMDNVMVDGLMIQGGNLQNGNTKLPADLALYESVEVLRGPAGLFAGSGTSGSPAGAINFSRKKPTKTPQLTMQASAGSWDNYRMTLDASGPLAAQGKLRGRAIISHIDRKFHFDYARRRNTTLGGVLELDLTPTTTVSAGLDWEHRNALPSYYGMPRDWEGNDPGWPRSKSTLLPWGSVQMDEYTASLKLDHAFSDDLRLKAAYLHKQSKHIRDYAAIGNTVSGGQLVYYIQGSSGRDDYQDNALDVNLTGKFGLFGRTHDFVLGVNTLSNRRDRLDPAPGGYGYSWNYNRQLVDFVNFDPSLYPYRAPVYDYTRVTYYEPTRQFGAYANFRFRLNDALVLTTGARNSRYRYGGETEPWRNPPVYKAGAYQRKGVVTPFAALSLDLNDAHTAHVSYAEIFQVQNRYDLNADLVEPLTGENYEVGLKSAWAGGRLQSMLTAYRLDRVNATRLVEPRPCQPLVDARGLNAACYSADQDRRTVGVDLELTGQVTPNWQISVGASWLKTKYTRWRDRSGAPTQEQGQSWNQDQPARTFTLWTLHRLPGAASGWRVGLGVQAQGRTWATWNQSTYNVNGQTIVRPAGRADQKAYALFNAMVSWDVNPRWNVQLNVDNLFDKRYLTLLHRSWMVHTEPRRFALNVTGKFD